MVALFRAFSTAYLIFKKKKKGTFHSCRAVLNRHGIIGKKKTPCFDASLTLTAWVRAAEIFNMASINNMIILLNDYFLLHLFTNRSDQFHNKIATGMKLESIMEGKQADNVHMIFLLTAPTALISLESLSFLPCRGQMMWWLLRYITQEMNEC